MLKTAVTIAAAICAACAFAEDFDPYKELEETGEGRYVTEFRSTSALASCLTVRFLMFDDRLQSDWITARTALVACKEELFHWYQNKSPLPFCLDEKNAKAKPYICAHHTIKPRFEDLPLPDDVTYAIPLLHEGRKNKDARFVQKIIRDTIK